MGAPCAMNHALVRGSEADKRPRPPPLDAQTPASPPPPPPPPPSDPPLHHRGRWRNPRQRVDVRDKAWREGGTEGEMEGTEARQKWECQRRWQKKYTGDSRSWKGKKIHKTWSFVPSQKNIKHLTLLLQKKIYDTGEVLPFIVRFIYGHSKFWLNWKKAEQKTAKTTKLLSSWGVRLSQWPEGGGWLIFMSLSTPAYINQSQPPSRKGVGPRMMWKTRDSEGSGEGREGVEWEEWAAVILKGCEQVTTPSAPPSQRRNSGSLAAVCRRLELMHANVWPHMCAAVLILCLDPFH